MPVFTNPNAEALHIARFFGSPLAVILRHGSSPTSRGQEDDEPPDYVPPPDFTMRICGQQAQQECENFCIKYLEDCYASGCAVSECRCSFDKEGCLLNITAECCPENRGPSTFGPVTVGSEIG